jgi:hypothetical protein
MTGPAIDDVANASISNVAGLATGAGIVAGVASFGTSLLFQVGASVLIGFASSLFRRKPRPRRGRDLLRSLADPTTFLPVVYGSHRVTGLRTFVWSTGNGTSGDNRFLWVCCALCHGPIAGIDEIYLDGYLAVNAAGTAQQNADPRQDFAAYVTAWKGYGTDGQLMYHPRSAPRTVTANSRKDGNNRYVDFSATHPYLVGDTIYISGISGSGISDFAYFVTEVPSTTRVAIGYNGGGVLTSFSSLSGACDYYNPDLPVEMPGVWTSSMKGGGVAFVLLRLVYDDRRFPAGMPDVEVNVRGVAMKDPRSLSTGTISTSAVSATGVPRHASAALLTESSAHGLVAGDMVSITGHSKAEVNGTHRVFDVPSSTTYRLPVSLSGAGSGGTRTKLAMSTTPALCIREFLTNRIYGPGVNESTELDDTNIGTEATYHETATGLPIENSATFVNQKGVSQIVVSGGTATATTTAVPTVDNPTPGASANQFIVGQTALVSGFSDVASGALNGSFVITAIGTNTFSFATAVANGTYACDTRENRKPRNRDELAVTIRVGHVVVTTPGTLLTTNGISDPSNSVQQTLEELLSSCRGTLIYQSGKFRLVTPRATTPLSTFALTDDTIVGAVTLSLPGQEDRANVVAATFPNKAANYQQDATQFPGPNDPNPELLDDNGLWLRKEIELPFTTNRATAQQICMVVRRESRARILQCVATEAALLAQVGDVVPVTRPVYGFAAKPFRILVMASREDDLVEITAVEHDDTWYNLDPNDDITFYATTPPSTHAPGLSDFRSMGTSGHMGPASMQSGLTITYSITSTTAASFTVSTHVVKVPVAPGEWREISYTGATVNVLGLTDRAVPLYIYADDPTLAGGAVTYLYSQSEHVLAESAGRYYVGSVTIPSGAGGSGSGTGFSKARVT